MQEFIWGMKMNLPPLSIPHPVVIMARQHPEL